jgi:putative endonuclease
MKGFFCPMNEFVVYILHSAQHQKIYIGYTSNLIQRFYSHNFLSKKGYTSRFRPWIVIHVDFFDSKKNALAREKFLKSDVGRKWIYQNLF